MSKLKTYATIIDIKVIGKRSFKNAFKTYIFETEDGFIIKWGTLSKIEYNIGFNSIVSFNIADYYIEDNKLVLIARNLRVIKK